MKGIDVYKFKMKHFPVLFFLLLFIFLANSKGAMPEATGAPGEITCGISICHNQSPNLGPGKIDLSVSKIPQRIKQKKYQITLQLVNSNRMKHGFEILALDQNQHNAGQWIVPDTSIIQLKAGFKFSNRLYLTHTEKGNTAKKWNFQWIAPDNPNAKITFYVSMIAANNNQNNFGDLFYHKIIPLVP